ncbi:DUF922 domain-containing protein [Oricola sp.]|uniref:DUF922 domain-containing protein n=1 Tax=Oricola sp. TaxID=1979950 RepID=UPI0025EE272E|nr:DUF922 domain-containing protein [Oricola sp.]MCI5076239.1 DUF922 domain-containing Zn-dependent protease [Oricola sp.]
MLAAVSACTSTSSRVTTTYYSIGGKTGADLDREIATKGPMKGHALASAAIKFVPVAISYDKSDTGCSYKTARFRIDANITLPRWSNQNSSDPGLRTAWRFLAEYAREHEQVHIDIAEEHARKLGEQLEALAPRKTCEALDAAGQQVLKRVKRDHNRAQLAFDAAENKRLAALYN